MITRQVALALVSTLAFGLVAFTGATPADAACDQPVSMPEALAAADSVFVGRVYSVSADGRAAVMEVLEIWKGADLAATVGVHGGDPEAPVGADDRTFEEGRTYLVVPENSRAPFEASLCSATALYRPTGEIPAEYQAPLGAFEVRYPEGLDQGDGSAIESVTAFLSGPIVMWSVLGLVAVGLAYVLLRGRLERRREEPKKTKGVKPRRTLEGVFGRSGDHRLRRLRARKR